MNGQFAPNRVRPTIADKGRETVGERARFAAVRRDSPTGDWIGQGFHSANRTR